MKIAVAGLRGFPDIQGGVESHCLNIYPRLVNMGFEVVVLGRRRYLLGHDDQYLGVQFVRLPCPSSASLETVVHTTLAVLYCGFWLRPDVLHLHAVGPGLLVPLARAFGLKVVLTHHGEDYHRQKWGAFASSILRVGEYLGCKFANRVIVISEALKNLTAQKYSVEATLIPNGVERTQSGYGKEVLDAHGLSPGRYILLVGRLVPEKRQVDAIQAFLSLKRAGSLVDYKLCVVGAADHQSAYLLEMRSAALDDPSVVFLGFQTGEALAQLYRWAGLYCLPSSHEGLPISLLEAMSYGCRILASDIGPNMEVGLSPQSYFPLGNIPALSSSMLALLEAEDFDPGLYAMKLSTVYNWDSISRATGAVFRSLD
jgi:glycosyltransferase involved in cell wall biosynthesis